LSLWSFWYVAFIDFAATAQCAKSAAHVASLIM
jgi:hypothetical protein